ncbi:MAG: hypothetical protein SNI45_00650 [Rikenellaceae bacterium]
MSTNANLLIGKWEFIGAEKINGTNWEPSEYVKGMTWEFFPIFFNANKTIGNISEIAPANGKHISLNYSFDSSTNNLRIEIYTDKKTKILDEVDIYELSEFAQSTTRSTMTLSLINQIGYPTPYMRYRLRRVE